MERTYGALIDPLILLYETLHRLPALVNSIARRGSEFCSAAHRDERFFLP